MDEKLTAGLVTFAVVAPMCAFCVLGPAMFGLFFGGMFGWVYGLNPVLGTGGIIIGSILVYAYAKQKRDRTKCQTKKNSKLVSNP